MSGCTNIVTLSKLVNIKYSNLVKLVDSNLILDKSGHDYLMDARTTNMFSLPLSLDKAEKNTKCRHPIK